ncbi:MAG: cell division protein FtsQ/DivIB [Polaromonas sp.]|nr:cell division protein FtsQ/DivIB [Polaromonas sp.]
MSLPTPLPLDIRLMNHVATVLGLVFVAMLFSLLGAWLMRQPLFALRAISVQGDLAHNNAVTLRANVAPRLAGNFFTADLGRTRAVFESVPWVRKAVVQRQFPNRLRVVLQEHQAIAYWGGESDAKLVNSFGEVFEANLGEVESEGLPQLLGPSGQAAQVLQAWQRLSPLFDKVDLAIERLELTGQGGWRAVLDDGAELELGHGSLEELETRVQRFMATMTQVVSRYGRDLESADLRYPNGYAIKLRGVTTVDPADKENKKVKR